MPTDQKKDPLAGGKPGTFGYYLEGRRGNRKVRYRDTDRDPIRGDTVFWLTWTLDGQFRYDERGAPQAGGDLGPGGVGWAGPDVQTARYVEQYMFEAARISKTPGVQTFGDKARIRR